MGASSHGDGPGARARASHHLTRYLINSKKVNASGGLGRFWSAGQGGAGLSDCARVLQTHVPFGPLRLSPLTSRRHSARHRLDDPCVLTLSSTANPVIPGLSEIHDFLDSHWSGPGMTGQRGIRVFSLANQGGDGVPDAARSRGSPQGGGHERNQARRPRTTSSVNRPAAPQAGGL